jgi:hypothetical protein
LLSDNDHANPAYPRFLFLDDPLIGLELQNRLPVLRILTSDAFRHYQIFLFTYDRVWFDLARRQLPEERGWLHRELLADETSGKLVSKQKPSKTDLEIAKTHLGDGDLKAAAIYARSAFEWKLHNVCEKHGIKIPFKPDLDKITAAMLWDGIIERQREREKQTWMGWFCKKVRSSGEKRERRYWAAISLRRDCLGPRQREGPSDDRANFRTAHHAAGQGIDTGCRAPHDGGSPDGVRLPLNSAYALT